jgi:cellulose synthase/poly-beta-1,6-N-acetylglucosamine synthase-like glycosyltransferase
LIAFLLVLLVLPLLLPAFSLLVLTLAALGRSRAVAPVAVGGEPAPRVAVLVPAHNESTHVLPTIACLRAELRPGDRLLVVADNCSDDTAELARGAGAEVIERSHAHERGKGYALAFGVDHLRADPPDVVLVVDADCVVSTGAVAAIALACQRTGRPVQMLDLMSAGAGAGLRLRVLEFAMVMKNLVRPLGSFRLGRACHLMGTGMALPWRLISTAELATGHIAEDMKLGVELTKAGFAPQFLREVRVTSAFVQDTGVARVQKSRWEHGHLATLAEELPGLLRAALARRDPALVVLAMDLMIPPVAFYFLLLCVVVAASLLAAWAWPVFQAMAALATLGAACFALAIGLGWLFFGRELLAARELLGLPFYALWKLPVYLAFFVGKRSGWVRTKRTPK